MKHIVLTLVWCSCILFIGCTPEDRVNPNPPTQENQEASVQEKQDAAIQEKQDTTVQEKQETTVQEKQETTVQKEQNVVVPSPALLAPRQEAPAPAAAPQQGVRGAAPVEKKPVVPKTPVPAVAAPSPVPDASVSVVRAPSQPLIAPVPKPPPPPNSEEYASVAENDFLAVLDNPLSTFSIDVDTAAYSNIRRFISNNQLPPGAAVRTEEFINYFTYDYPEPENGDPFSIYTEVSQTPWNPTNQLIHIGIQGKDIPKEELPPSNLVFLIDVSGSMAGAKKLPLVKSAFKMLVKQMRPIDRAAIVVYSNQVRTVLPSTSGNEKQKILETLQQLQAGGSTAGGAGIQKAYEIAQNNFFPSGNNRVIMASDGDFNVGISNTNELIRFIQEKKKSGVFLTILGFGIGNYKDAKMEQVANQGNGNYGYIDNLLEAKKMMVKEMGGTFFTIAKDVKIQVEFNPTKVRSYRLIGYENRLLEDKDFNDDTKDAGEVGVGHSVTALYEIIPTGSGTSDFEAGPPVDPLKYQKSEITSEAHESNELMTVKLRYKRPDEATSQVIQKNVIDQRQAIETTSNDFKFSAAVAEYGMLLTNSKFKGDSTFDNVLQLARASKGNDDEGYRAEFIRLVEMTQLLAEN